MGAYCPLSSPLLALAFALHTAYAALDLCSSQNTGTFLSSSLYQSNGLCHDDCTQAGYALAIVSGQDCYCGNYLPAQTVDSSECSTSCSGYPQENCAGDGVFGYIQLKEPSGTLSASRTTTALQDDTTRIVSTGTMGTTTSTTASSTSITTTTSPTSNTGNTRTTTTSTSLVASTTTSSTTSSTTSPSTSPTTSTTTSSASPTTTATRVAGSTTRTTTSSVDLTTPVITSVIYSVATVTQDQETQFITNQIATTITQTPSLSTTANELLRATATATTTGPSSTSSSSSFFDDKGKVAGVFTAVGIVAVVLIGLLAWCCVRYSRRHGQGDDYDDDDESVIPADVYNPPPLPQSRDALGRSGTYVFVPSKKRGSDNSGSSGNISPTTKIIEDDTDEGGESGSEMAVSSTDETVIEKATAQGHSRNMSLVNADDFGTPVIYGAGATYIDQRLDVGAMRRFSEREEVLSLGDHEDYSRRVLRVRNPDEL